MHHHHNTTQPQAGHPTVDDIYETARIAYALGLCVVPPIEDGTKRPQWERKTLDELTALFGAETATDMCTKRGQLQAHASTWKHFQVQRPTPEQIRTWYQPQHGRPRSGIGLVTGKISNHLKLFEFDQVATYGEFVDAAADRGMLDLVDRIRFGYEERTPGGGWHWLLYCDAPGGNTELAKDVDEHGEIQVLIETREEGGFVVISPSNGRVHKSGGTYELLRGGLDSIVTITPDEWRQLCNLAREFDKLPTEEETGTATGPTGGSGDDRPGDIFNERATWREILEPHGWELVQTRGAAEYWKRPGDTDSRWSAVINSPNVTPDRFWCYSTSTPFQSRKVYTKFAVYAILNHGGDYSAAGRDLRQRGYRRQDPTFSSNGRAPEDAEDGSGGAETRAKASITISGDLPLVTGAAWEALLAANDPARFFRFGSQSMRIELNDQGKPILKPLDKDRTRHELARAADWFKITDKGPTVAMPPVPVVLDLLATPTHPLPVLINITETPAFAPDGSLSMQPGYNPKSRSYYAPAPGFEVPPVSERPTDTEIKKARSLILDELLVDFPFVGEPERAHAVALLLLPIARNLIDGPTPLHLVEKPTPGTGASLMVNSISIVASGRSAAVMTEARDEDEWRKRITSTLRDSPQFVHIDNVSERLDSAALSAVLTGDLWVDRMLGKSENVNYPNRAAWIATGNNPALSSEIARRTVRIRMDAKMDRPWERSEFRHEDIRKWALDQRPRLVWALLTMGRHWLAQGRPKAKAKALGSYESWSSVIGGILDANGIDGFLGNLDEFYEAADQEGEQIRSFLRLWLDVYGQNPVTVAQELYQLASGPRSMLDITARSEQGQKVKLGKLINSLNDRIYRLDDETSVRVESPGKTKRAAQWRLVRIAGGGGIDDDEPDF